MFASTFLTPLLTTGRPDKRYTPVRLTRLSDMSWWRPSVVLAVLAVSGFLAGGGVVGAVGQEDAVDCSVAVFMEPGGVERGDTVVVLNDSSTEITVEREHASRGGVDCPDSGVLAVGNTSTNSPSARTSITFPDDRSTSVVEFRVPENVTAGRYVLRVRVGNATGTTRFRVIDPESPSIGGAIITDYDSESTAPGKPSIQDLVLPQGGYVEIRDGDAVVSRSEYLPRGAYRLVALGGGIKEYRAVVVAGTPNEVTDTQLVSTRVSVDPYLRRSESTPTPPPTATPTTAASDQTTKETSPGLGTVITVMSVLAYVVYRLRR